MKAKFKTRQNDGSVFSLVRRQSRWAAWWAFLGAWNFMSVLSSLDEWEAWRLINVAAVAWCYFWMRQALKKHSEYLVMLRQDGYNDGTIDTTDKFIEQRRRERMAEARAKAQEERRQRELAKNRPHIHSFEQLISEIDKVCVICGARAQRDETDG